MRLDLSSVDSIINFKLISMSGIRSTLNVNNYVTGFREENGSSTSHEQRISKIFDRLNDIRSGVEMQKDKKI
jgi:hypothetical protein